MLSPSTPIPAPAPPHADPTPGPVARPAPPAWFAWSARLVRHLPAGRYRAMNRLCRRPPAPFVADLPGAPAGMPLRFECDLRNSLAREVFFTGAYEPQETALVRRMLAPGGTFADVGAHWGYFCLIAAERVGPGGRLVAVEADPRIFGILARTLALNPGLPARAIHAAAAAEPGMLTLAGCDVAGDNWGISRLAPPGVTPAPGAAYQVEARPLDALMDDAGLGAIDLIKVDIEGAEALALRGMAEGLRAGRYRRVLLELHPALIREHGEEPRAVVARLTSAGYRCWTIDHAPGATRRAAYARGLRAEDVLRPLDPDAPLDDWPHVVAAAPGVELFAD